MDPFEYYDKLEKGKTAATPAPPTPAPTPAPITPSLVPSEGQGASPIDTPFEYYDRLTKPTAPSVSAPPYTTAPYTTAPYTTAPYTMVPSMTAPSMSAPSMSAPSMTVPSMSAPSMSVPERICLDVPWLRNLYLMYLSILNFFAQSLISKEFLIMILVCIFITTFNPFKRIYGCTNSLFNFNFAGWGAIGCSDPISTIVSTVSDTKIEHSETKSNSNKSNSNKGNKNKNNKNKSNKNKGSKNASREAIGNRPITECKDGASANKNKSVTKNKNKNTSSKCVAYVRADNQDPRFKNAKSWLCK